MPPRRKPAAVKPKHAVGVFAIADRMQAEALEATVDAMIDGPLSVWDHTRPIGSLTKADLRKLANAAISGFVLKRADQDREWERILTDQPIFDVAFAG